MIVTITIPDVCSKPRMVNSDRWKQRPAVLRYRAFADLARLCAGKRLQNLVPDHVNIVITIGMPKTWSKKKRAEHDGKPHRGTPDWDNLGKSVCDALWKEDDSMIWKASVTKLWGRADQTVVTVTEL